jgi:hypothetical protein
MRYRNFMIRSFINRCRKRFFNTNSLLYYGLQLVFIAVLPSCGGGQERHCAPGTQPDLSGTACVPDGSVICGDGTVYDAASGTCVPGGCPESQVLVNGTCTADVRPDAEETAEPNDVDQMNAGTIQVPAVGAPGYVVHGCIVPRDDGTTADQDPWEITVTEPTLLDVTAVGTGGLAAAFLVAPTTLGPLANDRWQRVGLNLVDSTSHRQVFLPAAGDYQITFLDSRQVVNNNSPAGSSEACYFATISQLALPAPTLTSREETTVAGAIGGEVQFFSVPVSDGDLLLTELRFESQISAVPSLVQQRDRAYAGSNFGDGDDLIAALFYETNGPSDHVIFVVDSEHNFALEPVSFTLKVSRKTAPELPADGQSLAIVQPDPDNDVFYSYGLGVSYFRIDVDADDLINLKLGFSDASNFLVGDPVRGLGFSGTVKQFDGLLDLGALGQKATVKTQFQGWYQFKFPGRYYVMVSNYALASGDTLQMTSTQVKARAAPLAFDSPISGTLGATNSEWFTFDAAAKDWITATVSGVSIPSQLKVDYYPAHGGGGLGGLVDVDFGSTRVFEQLFTPDGEQHGHIRIGDPAEYLVRVSQSGTGPVDSMANFTLATSSQTFVDLGTFSPPTPTEKFDEDLGGDSQTKRYLLRGSEHDIVTINVQPTGQAPVDLAVTVSRLDSNENVVEAASANTAGEGVMLQAEFGPEGYVAFAVTGIGTATKYDVHITAASPSANSAHLAEVLQ